MSVIKFPSQGALGEYTYLPVTMEQFERLTNDILSHVNTLMKPHALDADYLAQVLMSAIHAIDHKHGRVKKAELFEACVNRISCHVTYHAVEEIQKRIKAKGPAETVPLEPNAQSVDPLPDDVQGVMPPAPPTVA